MGTIMPCSSDHLGIIIECNRFHHGNDSNESDKEAVPAQGCIKGTIGIQVE